MAPDFPRPFDFSRTERIATDEASFLRERITALQGIITQLEAHRNLVRDRLRELVPSDPLVLQSKTDPNEGAL